MRIVITAKGMRGRVSVSMVNAIFQRLFLPAVKIRFMLGFGKSLEMYTLFKILLSIKSEM